MNGAVIPTYNDAFLSVMFLDDSRVKEAVAFTPRLLASVFDRSDTFNVEPVPVEHPFYIWAFDSKQYTEWMICYLAALISRQHHVRGDVSKIESMLKPFVDLRDRLEPNKEFRLFPNITTYPKKPIHVAYRLWMLDQWRKENPKWFGKTRPLKSWSDLEVSMLEEITTNVNWLNKYVEDRGMPGLIKIQIKSTEETLPDFFDED